MKGGKNHDLFTIMLLLLLIILLSIYLLLLRSFFSITYQTNKHTGKANKVVLNIGTEPVQF